jgi:thiazole synthase
MDALPSMAADTWRVAGRDFTSRLIVGTGKYKDLPETAACIAASGAEIVTVAVRRVNLSDRGAPMLQDFVDPSRITYLPNTAGCHTAQEAVRTLRLAREAGGWNLVKLEVLGPLPHLYPDMPATFEAAEALIRDGFHVMVYCADDPLAAKRLEDMGCVAIMPLGAPIGSGLGLQNPAMISILKAQAGVPVLVDAGVGTASDAADPVRMALAMKAAVTAGRHAFLAGRMARKLGADPSSPLMGLIR